MGGYGKSYPYFFLGAAILAPHSPQNFTGKGFS